MTVSGFPTTATAGVAYKLTVTAHDAYGNVATGYSGTVAFTSSDPKASLPANYTFTAADAGTMTFSATLVTAGTQNLTATDTTTSTITGTESNIAVQPSTAQSLTVSGFPRAATAGVAYKLTVTADDAFGNAATGYTGTVAFSSSDLKASLPGNYTFTAADAGTMTFSATLVAAGTQNLTATDTTTSTITGTESTITVQPSTAQSLAVSGFPSAATAGVAYNLTVTAHDAYGNVATGYTGTVAFSSSDSDASLPANYTFTAADAGTMTFSATLVTAGTQSLTATDTTTSTITGTESNITVQTSAAQFLTVSGFPTTTTAGVAYNFTVTVFGPNGEIDTGYVGTVAFSSSDPNASLPANYTFTAADAGTMTFSATLVTAGTQNLTATDTTTSTITGTESNITVQPSTAQFLTVSGFPTTATAGVAYNFTVTARDIYGNVATGYTGTVAFSSSDSQALLPANYTFTSSDAGQHTFSATLETPGIQWIAATDTGNSSINGQEANIRVSGHRRGRVSSDYIVASTTQVGTANSFSVTSYIPYGNVANGSLGTVQFPSSDTAAALPGTYTVSIGDVGTHRYSITFGTGGIQTRTTKNSVHQSSPTKSGIGVS